MDKNRKVEFLCKVEKLAEKCFSEQSYTIFRFIEDCESLKETYQDVPSSIFEGIEQMIKKWRDDADYSARNLIIDIANFKTKIIKKGN